MTLPSDQAQWLDHSSIKGAAAMFDDGSGLRFLLLVIKAPENLPLNKKFLKDLDAGYAKSGVTKISGAMTRFRDVPCYDMRIRLQQVDKAAIVRAFPANGFFYQLQIIAMEGPLGETSKLEPTFSAFEFIGTPSLPREPSAEEKAFKSGEKMGRITAYIVLGVIVLLVARYAVRRLQV